MHNNMRRCQWDRECLLSDDNEIPLLHCANVFAQLTDEERAALRAILSGKHLNKPYRALRRLFDLGLINSDGERMLLTENGREIVRLC